MFSPDCICVCSFSTTSPSPIRSWVILMPVMAVKAGASTFDFVFVRGDGFGDDLDVHAGERLGGIDEPLHFGFLLGAVERRQVADLLVEEGLGFVHAGPGRCRHSASSASAHVVVVSAVRISIPPLEFCDCVWCVRRHAVRPDLRFLPRRSGTRRWRRPRQTTRAHHRLRADKTQPGEMDEGAAEQR